MLAVQGASPSVLSVTLPHCVPMQTAWELGRWEPNWCCWVCAGPCAQRTGIVVGAAGVLEASATVWSHLEPPVPHWSQRTLFFHCSLQGSLPFVEKNLFSDTLLWFLASGFLGPKCTSEVQWCKTLCGHIRVWPGQPAKVIWGHGRPRTSDLPHFSHLSLTGCPWPGPGLATGPLAHSTTIRAGGKPLAGQQAGVKCPRTLTPGPQGQEQPMSTGRRGVRPQPASFFT